MKAQSVVFGLLFAAVQSASGDASHKAPEISKELEAMKQLLGTWEGTARMGDKDHNVTVVYELTSGGTAITEKLMTGTPQEMVSVYHKDGKSVSMTHYCSMGNQPHMNLKKSDGKVTQFEMTKPVGIESPNEAHMRAVTLSMLDADTLKHEWVQYEGGKQKDVTTFMLKRTK